MSGSNGSSNGNGRPKNPALSGNQRAFLAAYAAIGNITDAAKAVPIHRSRHYIWLKESTAYADEFESAKEEAVDALEAEARRRAVEGTVEPVFYQGNEVGAIRKYSDTLQIFLLNGARPEKYKYRQHVEVDAKVKHSKDDDGLSLLEDPEVAGALDRAFARRAQGGSVAEPGCSRN